MIRWQYHVEYEKSEVDNVDNIITLSEAQKLINKHPFFVRHLIRYFHIPTDFINNEICLNRAYFISIAKQLSLIKEDNTNDAGHKIRENTTSADDRPNVKNARNKNRNK